MNFLHSTFFRSAPVAQLDRAPDYESVGQRFESSQAHHKNIKDLDENLSPFSFL